MVSNVLHRLPVPLGKRVCISDVLGRRMEVFHVKRDP